MYRILSTSKSGMNANQTKLDTISNNLANSGTTGYKSVEVGFEDLLTETINRKGYRTNNESVMGTGVRTTDWFRNNSQGNLQLTSQSTDFALDGPGYFRVTLADGSKAYTRDGAFKVDALGRLVDSNGNKVELNYEDGYSEENCPLSPSTLTIDSEGNVYSKHDGILTKVAQVPIYTAVGDEAFTSISDNLFVPTEGAQLQLATDTHVYQGYLEMSNVDMTTAFTDLIITQRAFQLSSKGVSTADEMWGMINNMRR
ncbi:MAG: flagellar basal body rod protein FlgG [Clostridium sp.]|nr:flagellar basal body rod protein FlgG [Clostridium sp.]